MSRSRPDSARSSAPVNFSVPRQHASACTTMQQHTAYRTMYAAASWCTQYAEATAYISMQHAACSSMRQRHAPPPSRSPARASSTARRARPRRSRNALLLDSLSWMGCVLVGEHPRCTVRRRWMGVRGFLRKRRGFPPAQTGGGSGNLMLACGGGTDPRPTEPVLPWQPCMGGGWICPWRGKHAGAVSLAGRVRLVWKRSPSAKMAKQ